MERLTSGESDGAPLLPGKVLPMSRAAAVVLLSLSSVALTGCSSARHGPSTAALGEIQTESVSVTTLSDRGRRGPRRSPSSEEGVRKLVRNGRLTLAVDGEKAREQVRELGRAVAEEMGGYLASASNDHVTLRVPSDQLEVAMERMSGGIGHVKRREIVAQDVTDQHLDLSVRITNAQKLQRRLRELIDRAEDVKVILDLERELARVTTELERYEQQMRMLEERISLATLHVTLEDRVTPGPIGWIFVGAWWAVKWLFVW